jgi:hypothetical protein
MSSCGVAGSNALYGHTSLHETIVAQKRSIEDALRPWKFKPYVQEGRAVEVETGLMIRFKRTEM